MRVLITNDDGIFAPGIVHLVNWAKQLGEVVIAAPEVEQSAKSHAIEIHKPFRAQETEHPTGVRAYSVGSTPADCVRFMVLGLGERFDLVLSGINRGLNIGADIMYSGTVAAIFEAGNLGMQGMAVSTEPRSFDSAVAQLDPVWAYMREKRLFDRNPIYNVNIPLGAKGIRITRQGGPYYSDRFLPGENGFYTPEGYSIYHPSGTDELDTDTVLTDRCVSVMPLTFDRTDLEVFRSLRSL